MAQHNTINIPGILFFNALIPSLSYTSLIYPLRGLVIQNLKENTPI
jgi:hypothetical protein